MFMINPGKQLGIEFEHVNMLNFQNIWKASDAFAVIVPQQGPVLVSANARNFFSLSSAKKDFAAKCELQTKDIYHIYNLVERLQCTFSCIVGPKVAQS